MCAFNSVEGMDFDMKKKGFTLVELLGVVVILGIVSGLVVLAYVNVRKQMILAYYRSVEESLLVSGGSYFSANKENQPTIFGDEKKVTVGELVTNKYTDREIADPDGKVCNLEKSYVGAYKNSYDKTNYYVCLECGDYKSDNIACNGGVNYTLGVRARKKNSKDSYKLDGKTWSSETVVLVFETLNDMETVVVEDETGTQKTCKLETKNKVKTCEIEVDKSSKFTYYAKTGETESKKGELTVLIDKTKPTFEIQEKGVNNVIEVEYSETEAKRTFKNKVYDIKDPDPESGIKSIEYSFEKEGAKDYYHGVGITDSFDVEKDLELGRYKLKVRVENNAGLKTEKTVTYVIYKKLAIPDSSTFCDNLTYNGSVQNLVKVNKEGYIYKDNMQTNAGSYEVTATLKENYRWSDNTTNARKFTCTIARLRTATTGSCKELTYNGSAQTLAASGNYVTYSNNSKTSAGTYDVTVNANDNYAFNDGEITKTLSCSIAKRAVTITAKDQKIDYGQTISKTLNDITVSNLVSGHKVTSITLQQSTTSATTTGQVIPSGAVIKQDTTNVTSNYEITYKSGNLTIVNRKICVKLDANGASSITGGTSLCCTITSGSSCNVTLPTINPAPGFSSLGWTNDPDALETNKFSVGQSVTVNERSKDVEEETFYAVTRSNNRNSYTITYHLNGATSYNYNGNITYDKSVTYYAPYAYNGDPLPTGVSVVMPTVARSGGSGHGWDTDPNYQNSNPSYLGGRAYSVYSDLDLYAITSRNITLSFDANPLSKKYNQSSNTWNTVRSDSQITSNKLTSITKTAYNDNGVMFSIPKYENAQLYRTQEDKFHGYKLLGLANTSNSQNVDFCFGDQIYLETNRTLYAVWADDYAQYKNVNSQRLAMRDRPSSSGSIVKWVEKNDIAYFKGIGYCDSSDGNRGWIPAEYIDLVGFANGGPKCSHATDPATGNWKQVYLPSANSSQYQYTCASNNKLLSITPSDFYLNVTSTASKQKLTQNLTINNQCGKITGVVSSDTNVVTATTDGVITGKVNSITKNTTKTVQVTYTTAYGCSENVNVNVKNTDAIAPDVTISISGNSSTCSGSYLKGATATITCKSDLPITNFTVSPSATITGSTNTKTGTITLNSTGSKTIQATCVNSEGTTTKQQPVSIKVHSATSACSCSTYYKASTATKSSHCTGWSPWTTVTHNISDKSQLPPATSYYRLSGNFVRKTCPQSLGAITCAVNKCTSFACQQRSTCCHN